jgi:uncharacterized membrane protein YphA (DoxX/SURF4 family)
MVTGMPQPCWAVSMRGQAIAILLARVLLASPFLYGGIDKCLRCLGLKGGSVRCYCCSS